MSRCFAGILVAGEHITKWGACTAMLCCIMCMMAATLSLGVGIGYNYCFVDSISRYRYIPQSYIYSDSPRWPYRGGDWMDEGTLPKGVFITIPPVKSPRITEPSLRRFNKKQTLESTTSTPRATSPPLISTLPPVRSLRITEPPLRRFNKKQTLEPTTSTPEAASPPLLSTLPPVKSPLKEGPTGDNNRKLTPARTTSTRGTPLLSVTSPRKIEPKTTSKQIFFSSDSTPAPTPSPPPKYFRHKFQNNEIVTEQYIKSYKIENLIDYDFNENTESQKLETSFEDLVNNSSDLVLEIPMTGSDLIEFLSKLNDTDNKYAMEFDANKNYTLQIDFT